MWDRAVLEVAFPAQGRPLLREGGAHLCPDHTSLATPTPRFQRPSQALSLSWPLQPCQSSFPWN